jgi:hypothetical protein
MFQNPHLSGQLARDRHLEALARAAQARIAGQSRAGQTVRSRPARAVPRLLSRVMSTAAWLRPASRS